MESIITYCPEKRNFCDPCVDGGCNNKFIDGYVDGYILENGFGDLDGNGGGVPYLDFNNIGDGYWDGSGHGDGHGDGGGDFYGNSTELTFAEEMAYNRIYSGDGSWNG